MEARVREDPGALNRVAIVCRQDAGMFLLGGREVRLEAAIAQLVAFGVGEVAADAMAHCDDLQ